jgi:hypothetical protein
MNQVMVIQRTSDSQDAGSNLGKTRCDQLHEKFEKQLAQLE